MTMTMRSTIRPRERILETGVGGAGKTYDALTIVAKTKADTCWLIDNDNSFERMIELEFGDEIGIRGAYSGWVEDPKDKEFGGHMEADLDLPLDPDGQVVLFDCGGPGGVSYQQMRWAKAHAITYCNPNDWIMIDSFTVAWDRIKAMFTEAVHDQTMGAYFMKVRQEIEEKNEKARNSRDGGKEQKNFNAFEGMLDYQPINAVWDEDWAQFMRYPPCHLYVTCELDEINQRQGDMFAEKDRSILAMWGEHGVKPRGQKRSGHLPATVFIKRKTRTGEYRFTTVKDKGRPDFVDSPVNNFAEEYLYRHGGFRMVDV